MTPRRILVTGASGFVGGHLAPRLAAAFPDAELVLCGGHGVQLEITDADAVRALVRQVRPEACIHLAAVSAIPNARADPGHAWQVNLHGTLSLAEAVLHEAPDCLLVHVSSADAYGRSLASGAGVSELAPLAPTSTYAATKAAADLAIGALAAEGLRCIRLRPFNHTGPGQTAEFVVPAFARQIARIAVGRQPPRLRVGALEPRRDFLDVRDVCAAYVACLQRAEALPPGVILNIASGLSRRIGDILRELLELAGIVAELDMGASLVRPVETAVACGDASVARAALAWAPSIPWERTLRDILDDWRVRIVTENGTG
jgi:GDP-4-dehydro-6-deoxy-D-mannose reductase